MRALSLVVGGALQDGLNALPNSCLDVQLYVVLEVLVFGGQVSPSSLETHKLPDTIFFLVRVGTNRTDILGFACYIVIVLHTHSTALLDRE